MAMRTGKVIEILQVMGITARGGWGGVEMEQGEEEKRRGGGEGEEKEKGVEEEVGV